MRKSKSLQCCRSCSTSHILLIEGTERLIASRLPCNSLLLKTFSKSRWPYRKRRKKGTSWHKRAKTSPTRRRRGWQQQVTLTSSRNGPEGMKLYPPRPYCHHHHSKLQSLLLVRLL